VASVALIPAAALITGAVCGAFVDWPFGPGCWTLVFVWAAAAAAWRRRRPALTLVALVAGFVCAGALLAADARQRALDVSLRRILDTAVGGFAIATLGPEHDHDPLPVRALLLEDAAPRDGFVSLRAHVTAISLAPAWTAADGGVSLSVSGQAAAQHAFEWRAGRTIEAPVVFRRPARYLNDGVADFERALSLDGTTLFGSIKSGLLVQIVERGTVVDEAAAGVRAHVRRAIERWVAPHDAVAAGIVTAVLIGDRTGLPDAVRDRLQSAGTYHVIAISGGNIAILAGLVLGALMLLGLRGRAAALIGIATLLAYSQIAAAGPSVWRATLMAVIYLTARLLDHRTAAWQAASLAAAVMVIAHPLDIRDPGFVLTFGATAALLEGARRGHALLPARRGAAWVAASIAASLAVELTLAPVSAQVFSRVTTAGLVLNLIAVPMMAVGQVAGIVVTIADALDMVAQPAGWIAYAASVALVESARLIDVAPWLTARVPPPGLPLLAAYYIALGALVLAKCPIVRGTAAVAAFVALLLVTGLHPFGAAASRPQGLRVTMFDVGQGEALLVEGPAGTLHIDAGGAPFGGGSFDIGARVLAPALWARGVHTLDTLLITHGDPDHIGGASVLLEDFRPRTLWEGIEVPRHAPSRAIGEQATAHGARREPRRAGETIPFGEAIIRVLHPPQPDWERPRVRNDDSVVLELRYRDVALLLTGDIGTEIERSIAPLLTPARVRILKVAHHGSRTSTSPELLDAWRPQIALISAGRGNSFGHPTPEVLARLQSIGARIYRTDRHGQITLHTDGNEVRIETFTGEQP
jgi:competence protein ComEC